MKQIEVLPDFNPCYGFSDKWNRNGRTHIRQDSRGEYTLQCPYNYDTPITEIAAMRSGLPIYKYEFINN